LQRYMRYSIVLFILWPGDPCEGWTPGSSSLSCESGPEEWTTLRKSLYRLYFTEGDKENSRQVVALTEELTEYAGACPLGYITARMTSLQQINGPSETENTFDEVEDLLRFIDNYNPPDIVSSGWPLYRTLRELRMRLPEVFQGRHNTSACSSSAAIAFREYMQALLISRRYVGLSVVAAVSTFLLGMDAASLDEPACRYLISAAYLALAVDRFPTF
ncbi:hypothetical protein FOZ63_012005, partial [Perkinsus olseni]